MVTPGQRSGVSGSQEERVRDLVDREALRDLLSRYFLALDQGTYDEDWAGAIFTEDVSLSFPPGDHQGIDGVTAFTRSFMSLWARTHHHTADLLINLAGDRAFLAFNVIATHVRHGSPPPPASSDHFHLGGRFEGTALLTPRGWRLQRLSLTVLWTTGAGAPGIAAAMAAVASRSNELSLGRDLS